MSEWRGIEAEACAAAAWAGSVESWLPDLLRRAQAHAVRHASKGLFHAARNVKERLGPSSEADCYEDVGESTARLADAIERGEVEM